MSKKMFISQRASLSRMSDFYLEHHGEQEDWSTDTSSSNLKNQDLEEMKPIRVLKRPREPMRALGEDIAS